MKRFCQKGLVWVICLGCLLFVNGLQVFAEEGNTGAFLVSGGTYGVDYEYKPVSYSNQGYGNSEGSYPIESIYNGNPAVYTPPKSGTSDWSQDSLVIKTSVPLTISTNGTATAGIYIESGVSADLTFDNVSISTYLPVNVTNGASLHLTLADGSNNTLESAGTNSSIQAPGIRCGENAALTIDDGRRNEDVNGNFITPENGRVSRDATLADGTEVHEGDRLTILDSENPGSLHVTGGYRSAAIGGGPLENSGNMTFNGGIITVRAFGPSDSEGGGAGAGIGGGHAGGGTVTTFNGGTIDAVGSFHGAAIGGGCTYTGGMSTSIVTYTFPDAVLCRTPSSTVAGDININGGFLKAAGCDHSNAFGQACGGRNTGKTITITGGTLLPSSVAGFYDIGGKEGDVIVTGGSVRLSGNGKFQSSSNDGSAWGDLEKNTKVFMTKIDLAGYNVPNTLVDNIKMTINGVQTDYGMPSYTDEQGALYFWLPQSDTAPEVRVELEIKKGEEKVDLDPFFITNATQGAVLKQYVMFTVDTSKIPEEDRLIKRYDGLSFDGSQQAGFLQALVGDGIAVSIPADGKLVATDKMTIQSQRLNENLEPDETEEMYDGISANVGKFQLTISSSEYSADASFANSFWGHRCYYKYAEITPADSVTSVTAERTGARDSGTAANKPITLTARVAPAPKEAATCKAPVGTVQFYINDKPFGDPAALEALTDKNETNHEQSEASIVWTPTADGGRFAVEGTQSIRAEYIPATKGNYTKSKAEPASIEISPVDQGQEDIGGTPIQVTDSTDGGVVPPDGSELEKVYGDTFTLELTGGDTTEKPTYVSSNPDIATVDEDGTVHIIGSGEVTITATRPGNGAFLDGVQEIVIQAGKKKLTLVSLDIPDKAYDGNTSAKVDSSSIELDGLIEGDAESLKEFLRVTASFPRPDVGKYPDLSARVELLGTLADKYYFESEDGSQKSETEYTDEASILRKDIGGPSGSGPASSETISVDTIPNQYYTGSEIEPDLVVRYGNTVLTEGVDYTVVFRNNIEAGTAQAVITGIGNYAGTLESKFQILAVNIDTNGDGKPDINIDTDGDGKPDVNIDTDGDKKPDVNIDTDGDGKPDVNIDTDGDGKPDVNIDTNGDGKPDVNIDTNEDGKPDVNIDTNGDGKPDINIDTNGDGKPDINIDTNGDGKPELNIDTDGDGIADARIDANGNGIADVDEKRRAPATGDDSRMGIWLAVTALCGLSLFLVTRKRIEK
ncbi:YDG domain-containing protein [Hominifimenecus sp. rT4P-3]|uniref:YDG domain-containing protein n=1 Tax=Hominifimenecus sp. rT4P-3 TaxID=3242979 RepID=UPI003DA29663